MISVEGLAALLNLPVAYLVRAYIANVQDYHVQLLSKGFFRFPEVIDIINAEGNRPLGTMQSKLIQNKLRSNDVFCRGDGYLAVR